MDIMLNRCLGLLVQRQCQHARGGEQPTDVILAVLVEHLADHAEDLRMSSDCGTSIFRADIDIRSISRCLSPRLILQFAKLGEGFLENGFHHPFAKSVQVCFCVLDLLLDEVCLIHRCAEVDGVSQLDDELVQLSELLFISLNQLGPYLLAASCRSAIRKGSLKKLPRTLIA